LSPSIVVISAPSAWTASTLHDLTAIPFINTVHAPHCVVSQPTFVPVKPNFSRSTWTSSQRGSTSASRSCPLTFMLTFIEFLLSIGVGSFERRDSNACASSFLWKTKRASGAPQKARVTRVHRAEQLRQRFNAESVTQSHMTLIVKGHPLPQQRGAVLRAGKEIGRPPTRGFQKRLRWRPHQSPPFVARRD